MNRNIAKPFTTTLSLLDVASDKTHKYKCFHGEDVQLTVNVVGEEKRRVDLSNTRVKIYFALDKNVNEPIYRQDTGIVVDNLGVITVMLEKSYIRIGNNVLKIVLYDEDQTVFLQPLIISCIDPLIGEVADLEIPDDIDVRDELSDIRRIIGDLQDFDDDLGREIIEVRNEYGTVGERLDNFDSQLDTKASKQDFDDLGREIIEARNEYGTVGRRLDNFDSQLDNIENEKATKQEVDVERKRIDSFTSLDEGSTTGDAELIDGRTGADGVVYSNIGNAIRTQVTNMNNDISDLDIFKRYNLATSLESGMCRNGSVVSVAGTYHTNKIFLRKGKKVYANNTRGTYGSNREAYKITDSGYSVLNRNTEDISDNYCRYDIQEDGYYIFNVIANGCVAYSKDNLSKYVVGCFMPDDVRNISVLYGKSISWIGDSIMEGYGYGGGFAKMIATKYNMTYQNLGNSGATVASGQKFADGINDRYCISLNIPNMTKSDYHIFEGGINDYSLSVPLGTFDKTNYNPTLDTTTFAGAFEKACMNMVNNFHDKKYGYIFVHRIATLTDKFEEYKNIAIQILKKWGIPYCDLDTLVPPLNLVTTLKQTYTANADGWHPNELGYKLFYVPKVIAFLESL